MNIHKFTFRVIFCSLFLFPQNSNAKKEISNCISDMGFLPDVKIVVDESKEKATAYMSDRTIEMKCTRRQNDAISCYDSYFTYQAIFNTKTKNGSVFYFDPFAFSDNTGTEVFVNHQSYKCVEKNI